MMKQNSSKHKSLKYKSCSLFTTHVVSCLKRILGGTVNVREGRNYTGTFFFFLQQAKNAELYKLYLYPGLLQALKRKSLTVAVLVAGEERLYTYSDLLQAWAREPFIVAFPAAGEDSELYVYLYHDLLQA